MPPIKVLGGQMRVKGHLKGVILWVQLTSDKGVGGTDEGERPFVPNWKSYMKTKSSCGRTQQNSKTEVSSGQRWRLHQSPSSPLVWEALGFHVRC